MIFIKKSGPGSAKLVSTSNKNFMNVYWSQKFGYLEEWFCSEILLFLSILVHQLKLSFNYNTQQSKKKLFRNRVWETICFYNKLNFILLLKNVLYR